MPRVVDRLLLDAAGPEQPVGFICRLVQLPLLDQAAEHVRYRLIERAGLSVVLEVRRRAGDAVRQLVADHVEAAGEAEEDLTVAVAVDHLTPVPERVVV